MQARFRREAEFRRDDEGASIVLVAVSLVLLLGVAAIVIDVGNLTWERRMLQNSADAAALAVAQDCAVGDCGEYANTATEYALENNRRGAHVEELDPDPLAPADGEVNVTASTGDAAGASGMIAHWFAAMIGHDEGLARAAAAAEWGAADVTDAEIPLTVSLCDWRDAAGEHDPDDWDPQDPPDLPSVDELPDGAYEGKERGDVIVFHDSGHPEDECTAQPGFDENEDEKLPAGWGWLAEDETEECTIEQVSAVEDDHFWAYKDPGNDPQEHCLDDALGEAIVIPVFVDFVIDNPRDRYLLWAPAAFYLTGYRFPGTEAPQGDPPCGPPDTCISGHFVRKIEAGSSPDGDVHLGLASVRLTE